MSIVYPDEESSFPNRSDSDREETMINKNVVSITASVKFEPELYIYIQKLMKEQSKTFDEIVNDIIRGQVENKVSKTIPYVPYVWYDKYKDIPTYTYPPIRYNQYSYTDSSYKSTTTTSPYNLK
jgi:hypothetical protein